MVASLPLEVLAWLPLVLAAVILYFRFERGRFRERLTAVARRRGGRVSQDGWLTFPRLSVTLPESGDTGGDLELQISAIFGNGSDGHTHTFAWLGGLAFAGGELEVRRVASTLGSAGGRGSRPTQTGDPVFDGDFRLRGDAELARRLLTPEVRQALQGFDARHRISLSLAEATAYRNGRQAFGETEPRLCISIDVVPPEVEELDGMIEATRHVQAALA